MKPLHNLKWFFLVIRYPDYHAYLQKVKLLIIFLLRCKRIFFSFAPRIHLLVLLIKTQPSKEILISQAFLKDMWQVFFDMRTRYNHKLSRRIKQRLTRSILVISAIFLFMSFLVHMDDGYSTSSGKVTLILTDKPESMVVRMDDESLHPFSMDLNLTGNIDGVGIISYSSNDNIPYMSDTIRNNFNLKFKRDDWYSDSCIIKFKPITSTTGSLKIDYDIYASPTKNLYAPVK